METNIVKKGGYVSPAQKRTLIDLLDGKVTLINGRFSATFTKKDAQKQWEQIGDVLNAIPGSKKTGSSGAR